MENNEIAPVAEQPTAQETASLINLLPEDMREIESLKSIKDVATLAKSYIHAQSLIGKKVVDLSKEDIEPIFNKLGRPDKPEGYEIPEEGIDPQEVSKFRERAFKAGLTKEAAAQLFNEIATEQKIKAEEAAKARANRTEANNAALKKEFGEALDLRIELAKKALDKFGGEEALKALETAGLSDNPAIIKLLSEAGKKLEEGRVLISDQDTKFGLTPEEKRAKARNLMRDPAYLNKRDPRHEALVSQISSLYGI